jgi:hypothetical protein
MRRRPLLLVPVLPIAGIPARADRISAAGAVPVHPPGEGPLPHAPRLPPRPPMRRNPVPPAERAPGRRLPTGLRHAMLRDARRLRAEATAVHDRRLEAVARTAALAPQKAARRLGLPRSPYRSSAEAARILGAPLPAVQAAQARSPRAPRGPAPVPRRSLEPRARHSSGRRTGLRPTGPRRAMTTQTDSKKDGGRRPASDSGTAHLSSSPSPARTTP